MKALKERGKQIMYGKVSDVGRDSLLVKETVPMVVKGRSERGKSGNSSTRLAIVNRT